MPFGTRAPRRSNRFGWRRKSTTSSSSAFASSAPATSPQVTLAELSGRSCAGITRFHRQAGREPLEAVYDLVRCCERDASLAPRGRAGGDALLVEPTRGVLDEAHAPASL